jgi:hypothetical protein
LLGLHLIKNMGKQVQHNEIKADRQQGVGIIIDVPILAGGESVAREGPQDEDTSE